MENITNDLAFSDNEIFYSELLGDALRSVLVRIINRVSQRGLPGDHHFYITFETQYPGVEVTKELKQRYPDIMTIVLQHQYWNLKIDDKKLYVTLGFNGREEDIIVPLVAIRQIKDGAIPDQVLYIPPSRRYENTNVTNGQSEGTKEDLENSNSLESKESVKADNLENIESVEENFKESNVIKADFTKNKNK